MIKILCFKWRNPGYRSTFSSRHVNALRDMVKKHTTVAHEFVCITDDTHGICPKIKTIKLWENPAPHYGNSMRPNCYARLKLFDPAMKDIIGERFLSLDLDIVIVSNIDAILKDPAEFKIWKVDGERMPCNGSMVLHTAGTRPYIWGQFNPLKVHKDMGTQLRTGFQGSDQAWIAENLKPGDQFFSKSDGIYSFRCHIEPRGGTLPEDAKIVFFHGKDDPWNPDIQRRFEWVRNNWKCKQESSIRS